MKANLLLAIVRAMVGDSYSGLRHPSLRSALSKLKDASKYCKHTCVSSPETIRAHTALVNTRQVRRLHHRKPDHPSVAMYG